jgi:hypothetical protein
MACNRSLLVFEATSQSCSLLVDSCMNLFSRHESLLRILRHSLLHDCHFSYLKYTIIQKIHRRHNDLLHRVSQQTPLPIHRTVHLDSPRQALPKSPPQRMTYQMWQCWVGHDHGKFIGLFRKARVSGEMLHKGHQIM